MAEGYQSIQVWIDKAASKFTGRRKIGKPSVNGPYQ